MSDQSGMTDDVILQGSTWAAIWHMSWPLVLDMASISVANFVECWVAGKLGADALAAVGVGGQIWFFMVILTIALSAGTGALISRFWGARDYDQSLAAAKQSLMFAVIFGIATAAAGLVAGPIIMKLLGTTPAVQDLGWQFMRLDMLSQIPFTLLWISKSIFRAQGNARTPMLIMLLVTSLVIVLEIVLCIAPFQIGISGMGLAWLIAGCVGAVLAAALLKRSELGACLNLRGARLSREWFERMMRIGLPACVQDLAWVGGNFLLFLVFARTINPTACQASWAIGLRVEEFVAAMPVYALSVAIGTIVGQNLGARQPDRAEKAGWHISAVGFLFNAVVGAVMFFGAYPIARAMSNDASVITYSAQYLQVVGLSEPFVAVWLILFGAMQGAGYTRWLMWATIFALTLVRIPLAWFLTLNQNMGPIGTWLALALSSTLLGILAVWRFKTGVWKHQQI